MSVTRVTRHISAPRARVYRALLDADAVRQWMVPDGMTSEIHRFEAQQGGEFRISLTYELPTASGKTDAQTDTFHGRFVALVPDREVVQVVEFESGDPAMAGEMTITYLLADALGGTDVVGVHEHLPPGVSPADNETGWTMSLAKLAALVEQERPLFRVSGPTLDARDPRRLADFYAQLLGWSAVAVEGAREGNPPEDGWVMLGAPDRSMKLEVQWEPNYVPPVWPTVPGEPQMMMHLDIGVGDLDAGVAWAVACGAAVAGTQPQQDVRVMIDPEGHPFCLFLDDRL